MPAKYKKQNFGCQAPGRTAEQSYLISAKRVKARITRTFESLPPLPTTHEDATGTALGRGVRPISQRALPNVRSTRKPTIAMPGRLKTICDQPSGLINIGVIRHHHWPEASILGVRSSATIRTGKQNCSSVTMPVMKRTVSIAFGIFCTMAWNARSRNPLH